MWELDYKERWALKNWCFWTAVLEKTPESHLDCKEIQPVHPKGNLSWILYWKDWCSSWNSNTLATWWEELTHWKRPWSWKRLKAGGEGDDRGWDGWITSLTQWTWIWVDSGSWWWTGRPGVLQSMGLQRVRHNWVTELNWSVSACHVWLFVTPWTTVCQASLAITNSWNLLKLMSVESVMPSNHLILCRPLLLSLSIFASIRVFSSESVLHIRWTTYWSFSFSISPSNEYPGLISLKIVVGSPCCPKDSQESSATPQFKSINSSALSLLYSPTLSSITDHWKNNSLD